MYVVIYFQFGVGEVLWNRECRSYREEGAAVGWQGGSRMVCVFIDYKRVSFGIGGFARNIPGRG